MNDNHGQQNEMTEEEHSRRHKLLHGMLDELVADMMMHTGCIASKTNVIDLMRWSCDQMGKPSKK